MARLNILIWHIHGSYLNALARVNHNWLLPVKPNRPEGYGGRGPTFDLPDNVVEVPAERVRDLELDLIVYQTPRNLFHDHFEILSEGQQALPKIYLEHNTPKPDAVNSRHPLLDWIEKKQLSAQSAVPLLVHVTHFNRLMWDCGDLPALVVEHSVAIDGSIRYSGTEPRGITIVNGIARRPRVAGLDIFMEVRGRVPLTIAGMETEKLAGLGDIPYRDLHRLVGRYRFLFSPIRYTSLPLAVIEAMTIGMPVVALATTELPAVIRNGVHGYISCDIDELVEGMQRLVADPAEARRMGDNARALARERFGLERFVGAWDAACRTAVDVQHISASIRSGSSNVA